MAFEDSGHAVHSQRTIQTWKKLFVSAKVIQLELMAMAKRSAMEEGRRALIDAVCAERDSLKENNYNLIFWAKRLLNENYGAENCGDHCRNSCRWCGLRNAVELVEAIREAEKGS